MRMTIIRIRIAKSIQPTMPVGIKLPEPIVLAVRLELVAVVFIFAAFIPLIDFIREVGT